MDSEIRENDGTAVVIIHEEALDLATCDAFIREMTPVVVRCPRIVIDLAEVAFIDSAGIGALAYLVRRLRERDGGLSLCGINDRIADTVALANLDRLADIYTTAGEAVAAPACAARQAAPYRPIHRETHCPF